MKRCAPAFTALVGLLVLTEGEALADPTVPECLAAADSAVTLAKEHKLIAERGQLLVCAASSCPAEIRKDCASHVEEVTAQIPSLIFDVKNGSGQSMNAVTVTVDGQVLVRALDGTAVAIDPGEHTFTFEMAGQPPLTRTLTVLQSQKDRHETIIVGSSAAVVPSPLGPPPVQSGLGTQRILAIVAGGVGVAGLAMGTAFGVIALSDKSTASGQCPAATCSSSSASKEWSSADSAGNLSTVGFIVGAVALAGGAVLWFTAPRAASTQVGVGPGMLELRGSF